MTQSNNEQQAADARLKQAIKDVSENVSIVGLKEAIAEKILWIRRIFQVALTICLVCVMYYARGVVIAYFRNDYANHVKLVDHQESLPLSNVTVCADVTISKAFIEANLTVPDALAKKVTETTGYTKTEFLDEFIKWISVVTIRRNIERRLIKYFKKLIAANPQMSHFTPFIRSAMIQCRDMLKTCKFAGKIFDCCKNAMTLMTNDGVCYQIAINHDINSLRSSSATRRQSILGKTGGLTIEASVNLNDTPWLADTTSGGFQIFVSPSAVAPLLSPATAPSEAETFILVTARERILNKVCLPDNYSPPVYDGGYYDPFGHTCTCDRLQDAMRTASSCFAPYMHYSPNSSLECDAEGLYRQSNVLLQANLNEIMGTIDNNKINWFSASSKNSIPRMIEKVERDIRSVSKFRNQCPPRCRYWEYSSTCSFVDLAKKEDFDKSVLYSRVHVFYTDFLYQQQEEMLSINDYLVFCNFGNVIVLYLGLSIVGIFEVLFWFSNFFVAFLSSRRTKHSKMLLKINKPVRIKRIRRVQVAPL